MASTTRVLDLVDTEIGIVEGHEELTNVQGNIQFNNIKFTYPERESVLDDISFTATDREGEKVVIDKNYVNKNLGELVKDTDLSKFIL